MRHCLSLVLPILLLGGAAHGCGIFEVPDRAYGDGDNLPPLEWEGERVVFGTNLFDEVCVGTIAALDATVESIEQELSLPPIDEKIPFYLLDDDTFLAHCGSGARACARDGTVFSPIRGMTYKRHELVHARLNGIWGGRLWGEGIAAALDQDGGCLEKQGCATADLDSLLAGKFGETPLDGYTAGADLVHGLLMDHGPAAMLAFMEDLTGTKRSPDEVRAIYSEHFETSLDEDFQGYMRGYFDEYTLAQRGCDSLVPAPVAGEAGAVEIQAVMDCSSPDVVNIYHNPAFGKIEWSFVVTPEQSGAFTFSWSPESDRFTLHACRPPTENWHNYFYQQGPSTLRWSKWDDTTTVILTPGWYKLYWNAEFGSTIDLSLTPPCTFELANCPAGQQCNIWNECRPETPSPAALGEACEQDPDGPLACEAGSRCVGGVCVAECDATQPCAAGQSCSRFRVCGPICSLLAQDCETGFTCLPSADELLTSVGSGVCIAAGEGQLLESCDWRLSDCAEGLSCERSMCLPLCDPNAPDPGCPAETPICNLLREGPAGFCLKKPPTVSGD